MTEPLPSTIRYLHWPVYRFLVISTTFVIFLTLATGWAALVQEEAASQSVPSAQVKDKDKNLLLDWVPLVASIIALIGVIISQVVTYKLSRRNLSTTANQAKNLAEIKKIEELLNDFYEKLVLILARDHLFAQDLRARQPQGYRMLISLFDREWKNKLSAADKALVEQVCGAAKELDELITKNLGEVDDTMIEYFVHVSAHFRVLHLAYEGKLGDESETWGKYVYPNAFDLVIHLKCQQLRTRRKILRQDLSKEHPPAQDLEIPKDAMYTLNEFPDPDERFHRLLYGPNK